MHQSARRCILAVFAHPDDETSAAAGTLVQYAREGVDIHVVTATRGELGALGTGGLTITRQDLPAVREAELRAVLALYGANPPILLGYGDQQLITADFETLTQDVLQAMASVRPNVVITFGPSGISNHDDHKTIHRAATAAFHRYRLTAVVTPRLYYVALPQEVAAQWGFRLHPSEMTLSVCMDIAAVKSVKVQGLRTCRSQADAQELALLLESNNFGHEWFYQAHPAIAPTVAPARGFWPEGTL
ncbi:MAG: PIG-L family deacetylase [Candidatus Tectomicrobia bacterium]|uniref:PIG-L family deacetylase n=1 Tax=Tectimicrobiota bacterium TaxID=2528274 RepID=A0A938B286_UNCTE|nr:PIG-L family deacetylase [Candidatus Tectomicrobia bacterium]